MPHVAADEPVQQGVFSTSVQGVLTVYSCHPSTGTTHTPVAVSIGVVPHEPHFIRGFRVVFGSHGTTTRVVGEKRLPDGERVELVASTPPLHLAKASAQMPASHPNAVPLTLQALDELGNVADWAEMGTFYYTGECKASCEPA